MFRVRHACYSCLILNYVSDILFQLNNQAFSIVEDGTTGLGVTFVPVFIETVKKIFSKLKSGIINVVA